MDKRELQMLEKRYQKRKAYLDLAHQRATALNAKAFPRACIKEKMLAHIQKEINHLEETKKEWSV